MTNSRISETVLIIALCSAWIIIVALGVAIATHDNFVFEVGESRITIELTPDQYKEWREMGRKLALEQLSEVK